MDDTGAKQNPLTATEPTEDKYQYLQRLAKKFDRIHGLWQKLTQDNWNDRTFILLQLMSHSLAASGKTAGLEQLSKDARKLDDYLAHFVDHRIRPSTDEQAHIDRLIQSLQSTAARCESTPHSIVPDATEYVDCSKSLDRKTVYILDDDTESASYLSTHLGDKYQIRTFFSPYAALEYITHHPPDLVIMNIVFPDGNLAGIETIDDIRARAGKRIPVIFVSSRTDLNARVSAVRSRGDAYMTKPIDVPHLLEKIDDLLFTCKNEKYRILIVDQDEAQSDNYALLLRQAGMETTAVNNSSGVLETLDSFNPDILLMDMYLPECNALELAAVIRQEDKYIGLPIVFVSAEGREDIHEPMYYLGIDVVIAKSITTENLVQTIHRHIKRARKLNLKISKLSKYDSKSLLVNRQYFLEQLELALTTQCGDHLKPALIDISIQNIDDIIDRVGLEWIEPIHQQLANVITRHINEKDLATQFSESVYMVLAHEQDTEQTLQIAQSLLDAITSDNFHLDDQDVNICANISLIPLDDKVTNLHALLAHAVELSHQANEHANNCVISDKTWDSGEQPVPVLSEEIISEALENNRFELAYQPIINLQNNSDEKYEVLLRLHDSNGKVLLPPQFFPLVKKKKLAPKLDRWVIEHAIFALANNSHTRGGTDLFIKISFDSLQDTMLLPRISNSITSSGLAGEKRIVFEINEKDLMIDQVSVAEFCQRARKLNCGVSVTNYGQSPQDIQIFNLLPVDYVKLHGSCLKNILTDKTKQDAIEQLINQALQNNAQIIAGTIEDPATLSLLWDLGARFFQGYYINKPAFSLDYDFAMPVKR